MKALAIAFWFTSIGYVEAACQEKVIITRNDGSNVSYSVEIADDVISRARGLMYRDKLDQGHGMLFQYDNETPVSFWMKNVSLSLDILFLTDSGTIIKVHENAMPFDLTPIHSVQPVGAVLEINGGGSRSAQITVGDQLSLVSDCS